MHSEQAGQGQAGWPGYALVAAHRKRRQETPHPTRSRSPNIEASGGTERCAWVPGSFPVAAEPAREGGTEPVAYLSEAPVMSAYALEDGTVYMTYSTTARGLEFMMGYYGFLDRIPLGRNEGDAPMRWMRRHDEYGQEHDGPRQ
jgi:predicted dithiol-disulfide oxidoreductase (DUF899 family)